MKHLVMKGKQVGILSNSTQLSSKAKEKMSKHGIIEGIHYHFYLTSGEVTRKKLLSKTLPFPTPRNTYFLFGQDYPKFSSHLNLFKETNYNPIQDLGRADFIYINIPHIQGLDQEDPKVFLSQIEQIKYISDTTLPVLCSNLDCFAHEGSLHRLVVRQELIAQMFKDHGFSVYFIGKPFPTVYKKAMACFSDSHQVKKVLMIGDTPETDIRGASQLGLSSALVCQTGINV